MAANGAGGIVGEVWGVGESVRTAF